MTARPVCASLLCFVVLGLVGLEPAAAQRGARGASGTRSPGSVSRVNWDGEANTVSYTNQGKRWTVDLGTLKRSEQAAEGEDARPERNAASSRRGRRRRGGTGTGDYRGRPRRGRQYTEVGSPDGKWDAHYENWNLVLKPTGDGDPVHVTKDGNRDIHYGTASWVYGEELGQSTAMWWTPDSRKVLFYKFDDRGVEPFHLVTGWSGFNTKHYPEFYPKAGATNPASELYVYDLASGKTTRIDAGGGRDEYLFHVRATPKGVMLVNWTDRLQQHLKVLRIDTETGACKVICEERQDTWQTNRPGMRFLKDGHRFIWTTEKSGFAHYELRDLDGAHHATITSGEFPCGRIQFVDEDSGWIGFEANSSSVNPYFAQYHVARLDGSAQRRVTSTELHHSRYNRSPDGKWLIAQYEAPNTPPCTALYAMDGDRSLVLAESPAGSAANLAELFTFKSDDGRFDIYGLLYKPRDFDPGKEYPVINSLYGGPGSGEFGMSYVSRPRSENNRGYLVMKVKNRGTGGRGKAFLGAAYKRLGDIDIQDHADGIRHLRKRPYVDGDRVGIVGGSYGGYMSAMGVLKHPDAYTCAVNRSGVTDWRHYDTIYTERYMSTPQLNPSGYDVGRATKDEYIASFKEHGRHILIMHGMVDDNVHPTNAFQLINALDKASVDYESRFFPNSGHGLGRGSSKTQWEFFDRILKPDRP